MVQATSSTHERTTAEDDDSRLLEKFARDDTASPDVDAALQKSLVKSRLFGGSSTIPKIGRYRIVGIIGEGGMGTVYEAVDEKLDRRVALKRLKAEQTTAAQRARILREARALGKISHPNVVPIFEIAEHEGTLFFAMEYVRGTTLQAWASDPRLRWSTIVERYIQAGRGLAAAHAAGLVHRDFKPHNAIVGEEGRVRVLDFGLVSAAEQPRLELSPSEMDMPLPDHVRTETGAILGTPAYMAPEQFRSAQVDHRTDQFSFCVSLYEALYGERPFHGWAGLNPDATLVPGRSRGPARLRRVLGKGLSLDPDGRFSSMDALLDALRSTLALRRRLGLAAGLVAVSGIAVVIGSRQPISCDDAVVPTAAWDTQRRADIEAAYEASTLAYAPRAQARAIARLDAWSERWTQAQRDGCEATHVLGVQSQTRLDARTRCLEFQRRSVHAMTTVLASADDEVVRETDAVLATLPDPDACADAIDGDVRHAAILDDGQREALGDALETIARARATRAAGKSDRAREVLAPLRTHPLLTFDARLRVEVDRVAAEIDAGMHGITHAVDGWLMAARDAQREQLDDLAATIFVDLTLRVVGELGAPQRERWIVEDARAALARVARPDDPRNDSITLVDARSLWSRGDTEEAAALLTARLERPSDDSFRVLALAELGCAQREGGQGDEARDSFEQSLALARATFGPDAPYIGELIVERAITEAELGKLDAAAAYLGGARAIVERTNGANSLENARLTLVEANVAAQRGKFVEGARLASRAVSLFEEHAGGRSPRLADAYNAQGTFAYYQGDYPRAIEAYRSALAIHRANHGDDGLEVASLRSNIAESQLALGHHVRALENFEDALAVMRKLTPDDTLYLPIAIKGRGLALLETQRIDEAIASLREALRLLEDSNNAPELAATRFGLARALSEAQPARARSLALLAEAAYAEFDDDEQRDRVRDWLARHP